ncbi:bifunctional ADP-dependent NAD(P)H-hydrate dehydratase/NAD(P)H-hydrate epimerase [Paenibacillus sp. FJAT-26967]|uniref:bifunctional ADP-dependent NAD(P)H-hydrate dehydratase/NAD(P)H-hydrate epimerase n=1 Tax=Paenibacillus sp. FJAT-26967 TaxID=1729690 RepID=UPI000837A96B|nr:bifunctional ADP-dependent NAD(P)H-hydrate dehydratase/NAD(P)H-hydrate epimerase [Paenibacillus sp. FJAT-26967]
MRIVTAEEMYEIDRRAVHEIGIREDTLMESAGQAVARVLMDRFPAEARIVVLAGAGNNGGDGIVIARVLKSHGRCAELWLVPPKDKLKGAAAAALNVYEKSGYDFRDYNEEEALLDRELERASLIVDALLGIGVKGELREPYRTLISSLNGRRAAVYAVDLPSGVPADGGAVEKAVRADATVTIQYPKLGAFTHPAASYFGERIIADIGIPPAAAAGLPSRRSTWSLADVRRTLPRRTEASHKGTHGRALVAGGSRTMPGAVVLASRAALRSGAGLVTTALPDAVHAIAAGQYPEAMYMPSPSTEDGFFRDKLPLEDAGDFNAIAVGPGLGRTRGARAVVEQVLRQETVVVLDADALFHAADLLPLLRQRNRPLVLTPHPGEMARLTGRTIEEVERDRFGVSARLAADTGAYIVLKGPYTIVTGPDGTQHVNTSGNAALAKGGSGDVLTGIITAFVMQHASPMEAISNAVFVHGRSAELLTAGGHSLLDVLASDVIEGIPAVLREILAGI